MKPIKNLKRAFNNGMLTRIEFERAEEILNNLQDASAEELDWVKDLFRATIGRYKLYEEQRRRRQLENVGCPVQLLQNINRN